MKNDLRQLAPISRQNLFWVDGDATQPSLMAPPPQKRILLVDVNDPRAKTRVKMLLAAGYEVEVREDDSISQRLAHEDSFDLILLSLHRGRLEDACAYSDRLAKHFPNLPILLVTDAGIFAQRGTLSRSMDGWDAAAMMKEIASMLAGSRHVPEMGVYSHIRNAS